MKTVRRLLFSEVYASVGFVTLGFVALFFFFDAVDELRFVNRADASGYQLQHALLFVSLLVPSRLYELLPITVLIGTIFVMSRLAQSSEFTILRTSGLGPWRALRMLLTLGMVFGTVTWITGDYIVPSADRAAQAVKARLLGRTAGGQSGAWLKEKNDFSSYAVNIARMAPDGSLNGVRIYEFDSQGSLVSITEAAGATVAPDSDQWTLLDAHRQEIVKPDAQGRSSRIELAHHAALPWLTTLSAEMVSVALLKPERMRTLDLYQYVQHLDANGQVAQRYEIEFWRKVFYPLSCLVMVVLALPFAYLHFRAGGIATYVFVGVMFGISFFLLNNLFGYAGNLQNWSPWLTAAAPALIYSVVSLAAFTWLVLKR
jgi:lipopolysaccharide export system permease protein